MKVLLTRAIHDFALKHLTRRYDVEVHSGKIPMPRSRMMKSISDADGLICFPYDMIDRKILTAAKSLKVISTFSVGFDHIDLQCAIEQRIRVGYTPDVLTAATADLTFGIMLDLLRRITEGDRVIRNGSWKRIYGPDEFLGQDLQSKTLGILGLGRIGSALAIRAKAFGMNTIYHNRTRLKQSKEKRYGVRYVSFPKLLKESDIISVHVPHTTDTDRIFNMQSFKEMKPSAYLINTSRGRVVDEHDLVSALEQGTIAGAGLDVFEREPTRSNSLTKMNNVVLTPHIGSSTIDTRVKMAEIVLHNLDLGIQGKKPIYSVGY